jgi:hypothetical protein
MEIAGTIDFNLDGGEYERFTVAPGRGRLQMLFEKHRPGKRCLWGYRRGLIQVGSAADKPMSVRLDLPRVNFPSEAQTLG